MTDWSDEFVKTGLAALAGAVTGWFFSQFQITSWATQRCFGPRLRLIVDQEDGSDICVPLLDQSGQPTENLGRYFRVKVQNDKGRVATGVRGYLTDIRKFNTVTNDYDAVGFCDTVPLNWSYRDNKPVPPAIEIPHGVKQFLNIVSLEQSGSDDQIVSGPVLCVSNMPSAYVNIIANGGKYLFCVLVQADNFIREEIGMIFDWDGQQSSVRIEICSDPSFKSQLAQT